MRKGGKFPPFYLRLRWRHRMSVGCWLHFFLDMLNLVHIFNDVPALIILPPYT